MVARYEFSTILVVSDSIGLSITVNGNSLVFKTSCKNVSTLSLASLLHPEQTLQKSRMEETYSFPGITRSKLCASKGVSLRPLFVKAFFRIGHATNSVVPGATVVSINTNACGGMVSPIVRMEASSAAISVSPVRMFPKSALE